MDIWQLEAFERICCLSSITKASRELFISQQALSKSIQKLEAYFDSKLLVRTSFGVTPTPVGEIVLEEWSHMKPHFLNMTEKVELHKKQHLGTFTIGVANNISENGLNVISLKRVISYQDRCPDTRIHVIEHTTDGLLDKFVKGEIDIACVEWNDLMDKYPHFDFAESGMTIICAKDNPLSGKKEVTLRELSSEPILLMNGSGPAAISLEKWILMANPRASIVRSSLSLETYMDLIYGNAGIGITQELYHPNINKNLACLVPIVQEDNIIGGFTWMYQNYDAIGEATKSELVRDFLAWIE